MTEPLRIGVLGVGNVLMGDDGIGPFVVKILESRYEFPENVVLHDLGMPRLGITSFFMIYDALVLIDAVNAKAAPGEVVLYRKEELVSVPLPHCISPHDPALIGALLFAELSGSCPKQVLLVGVVPKTTELGCRLSEEVKSAVEPAISAVLTELDRLGVHVKARAISGVPSIRCEEKVV